MENCGIEGVDGDPVYAAFRSGELQFGFGSFVEGNLFEDSAIRRVDGDTDVIIVAFINGSQINGNTAVAFGKLNKFSPAYRQRGFCGERLGGTPETSA